MAVGSPHKINKLNNFIAGWYIDKKVCTDLINYFNKNPSYWEPGMLGRGEGKKGVNKKLKSSTDLTILLSNGDREVINYSKALEKVLNKYKKLYKYCSLYHANWQITQGWNIQRYKPGEGYFGPHCERTGPGTSLRHLTFMTYLNDVKSGGETEFLYQKLKVKPEIGLTLIWGTDWTTTHKGITSKRETKYITTGWYSYTQ
tara:strand:+ start:190 stop:792 length:603 start_codon:yes stop_codon:yes gene_type:complete